MGWILFLIIHIIGETLDGIRVRVKESGVSIAEVKELPNGICKYRGFYFTNLKCTENLKYETLTTCLRRRWKNRPVIKSLSMCTDVHWHKEGKYNDSW